MFARSILGAAPFRVDPSHPQFGDPENGVAGVKPASRLRKYRFRIAKFKIQNGCKPCLSRALRSLNIEQWDVLSDFFPKLCANTAPRTG